MEIFSASLTEFADTFLHPGYMSAYAEVTMPGPMTAAIVPVDREPVVQIDMVRALQLNPDLHEAVAAEAMPIRVDPATPALPWAAALALALALGRGCRFARSRRPARLLGAAAAVALVLAVACSKDPVPEVHGPAVLAARNGPRAPARATAPFLDPRAATEAILNGIIADAVACSEAPEITSLDSVSWQVGLPASHKTPGMRWAIANYQDDGWGRRFRFRTLAKDRFEVKSAGEDGAFDTGDDLALEMRRAGNWEWPSRLRAYYLRRERDDAGVSFHRCGGMRTHRVHVHRTARGLLADPLFGVIPEQDFPEVKRKALRERIQRVTGDREQDALVLVVFDPKLVGRLGSRSVLVPR